MAKPTALKLTCVGFKVSSALPPMGSASMLNPHLLPQPLHQVCGLSPSPFSCCRSQHPPLHPCLPRSRTPWSVRCPYVSFFLYICISFCLVLLLLSRSPWLRAAPTMLTGGHLCFQCMTQKSQNTHRPPQYLAPGLCPTWRMLWEDKGGNSQTSNVASANFYGLPLLPAWPPTKPHKLHKKG